MAGMDLSTRRDAPGISVFWLILGMGALVALLIGLAVVLSERTDEVVQSGADPEAVNPVADARADMEGMTVPDIETPVDSANFEVGPEADVLPARPEVPPHTLDVVIDPDFPLGPESPRPNTEERIVTVPVPATDLVVTAPATVLDPDLLEVPPEEGPIPGSPPVVPTPSGPAGADGNPLTPD